jgi:hypothetical protein
MIITKDEGQAFVLYALKTNCSREIYDVLTEKFPHAVSICQRE